MAHTFTNLLTHVIFSTKDRLPHIDADLKAQLVPIHGAESCENSMAERDHQRNL